MKKLFWLLIAAAALFISCQQDNEFSYEGKPVRFSATSSSINTKTAYQGTVSNGKEAILWEDGDVFRVQSKEASVAESSQIWADYAVKASEQGQAIAVSPVSSELLWGSGAHHFYAVYPAGVINDNVVKASIPKTQKAIQKDANTFVPDLSKYGYMVAATDASPSDDAVTLNFKPVFTTLEFTVSPGNDADVVVSGFCLKVKDGSKQVISGGFNATLSAQEDPKISIDYTDAKGEVEVVFGQTGEVKVNKGETLTFSVLALPVQMSNLTAVFTVNGKEISLPLVNEDGSPITFEAGQKARVRAIGALNPKAKLIAFSVLIESQDVKDYDLSVPGSNGGVDLLPGVFKVGDKIVRMAKGNLQAVLDNGTITKWQFADHQWETASDIRSIPNETGVVGKFLTSTTAPLNRWGTHFACSADIQPEWCDLATQTWSEEGIQFMNNYYIGTVVPQWENPDFKQVYGQGWASFDISEALMTYIETVHGYHGSYTEYYEAHCTPASIGDVKGLILFPEGYVQPQNIPLERPERILYDSGGSGVYGFEQSCFNQYSSSQWEEMERAGAAFFPNGRYGVQSEGELVLGGYYDLGTSGTFYIEASTTYSFFACDAGLENPGMIRLVQFVD